MFPRKANLCVLVAILTSNCPLVAAAQSGQEIENQNTYEEATRMLDKLVDLIDEVRSHIDRSQFDINALTDKLDYDAESIIRYVKTEICFQQYLGALRGSEGALISRAGNSLDQAVLLARLLKDSGFDARIARGTISISDAELLVSGISNCNIDQQKIGDTKEIESLLFESASTFLSDSSELTDIFSSFSQHQSPKDKSTERAMAQAHFLIETLRAADGSFAEERSLAMLANESTDYYWVQYREGPSQKWENVHPSFGPVNSPHDEPRANEVFLSEIPTELTHQIGIKVLLDRRIGNKIVRTAVTDEWRRPAPNLNGVPLTLTFASLSGAKRAMAKDEEVASAIDIYVPMLNGIPGSLAFDDMGNIVPAAEAATAFSALFQTVGSKFNIAGGALSNLGNSGFDAPDQQKRGLTKLVRIVLEVSMISPRGDSKIFTRTFSPDNEDSAVASSWSAALSQQYTVGIAVGNASPAYLLDHQLASLRNKKSALQLMMLYRHVDDPDWSLVRRLAENIDTSWIFHPMLYAVFDNPQPANDDEFTYRHEPSIVVHRVGQSQSGFLEQAIDVVSNKRRAFRRKESTLNVAPDVAVANGVWETLTESWLLDPNPSDAQSSFAALEGAQTENVEMHIFTSDTAHKLADYAFSKNYQNVMEEHLARGQILIVPVGDSSQSSFNSAFWSIDPDTGSTLGINQNGEGQALAEYRIMVGATAFTSALVGCLANQINVYQCFALAGITAGFSVGFVPVFVYGAAAFSPYPFTMAYISALVMILKHLNW